MLRLSRVFGIAFPRPCGSEPVGRNGPRAIWQGTICPSRSRPGPRRTPVPERWESSLRRPWPGRSACGSLPPSSPRRTAPRPSGTRRPCRPSSRPCAPPDGRSRCRGRSRPVLAAAVILVDGGPGPAFGLLLGDATLLVALGDVIRLAILLVGVLGLVSARHAALLDGGSSAAKTRNGPRQLPGAARFAALSWPPGIDPRASTMPRPLSRCSDVGRCRRTREWKSRFTT
jgi:hypothetical protein